MCSLTSSSSSRSTPARTHLPTRPPKTFRSSRCCRPSRAKLESTSPIASRRRNSRMCNRRSKANLKITYLKAILVKRSLKRAFRQQGRKRFLVWELFSLRCNNLVRSRLILMLTQTWTSQKMKHLIEKSLERKSLK